MSNKKNSSGGGWRFPGVGVIAHIVFAAVGTYKCKSEGCGGTLDWTFKCRRCGRRGLPGL